MFNNIDFKYVIVFSLVLGTISTISNFIHSKIQEREGKKSNYNCNNCKAWDCPAKQCSKKMGA